MDILNAPLVALLNQVNTLGIAICNFTKDEHQQIATLHCKHVNQKFSDCMQLSIEKLENTALFHSNYDFIKVINEANNKKIPLLVDEGNYLKVDIIPNLSDNELIIILNPVTEYIQDYKTRLSEELVNQFFSFAESSGVAMMVSNMKDNLFFNEAYVKLFGYNNLAELQQVKPDDLSPEFQPNGILSSELMKMHTITAIKNGFTHFEWIHLIKDKSPLSLEINLNYMIIEGKPLMNATLKDLSEAKKLEAQWKAEQEKMIDELSIPITPLLKDIILLPLVGIINEKRANLAAKKALMKIAETESRIIIIDVSGVNLADVQVAVMNLLKLAGGAYLMGCTTILSGLSPQLAKDIVDLNINLDAVIATANLEGALKEAVKILYA